ncbi:MAG: lipase maturation factor family protein [Candidatus Eisenbacteria bacterium]
MTDHRGSFVLSRDLFVCGLGLVYLIAFVSLWTQILGLVGSHGIIPIGEYLDFVHSRIGDAAYWRLPTLCWIDSSDAMLQALCATGTIASAALILGLAPIPILMVLWVLYLSASVAGQDFLSFQWDSLLLEAGVLALFVAPRGWWMRLRLPGETGVTSPTEPWRPGLWLLRLLVFKLMFLSGITKLLSGDPTWRNLSAMSYHYQTQPIPTWTSWYMDHLPVTFHRVECLVMFVIEIGVPFLLHA